MQNGANVNKLTKNGFCPLRTAAQENHVAIAESLIRNGTDTEIESVVLLKYFPFNYGRKWHNSCCLYSWSPDLLSDLEHVVERSNLSQLPTSL